MDSRIQVRMINWTFVLVIGLGLLISALILDPPRQATRKTAQNAREATLADRIPASIPPLNLPIIGALQVKKPALSPDALELDFPCGKDSATQVGFNVQQIRINSVLCEKTAKNKHDRTEILNQKNGIQATVFFRNEKDFSTDYVPLAEGENAIVISHVYSDGSNEKRRITIQRDPAPTQNN